MSQLFVSLSRFSTNPKSGEKLEMGLCLHAEKIGRKMKLFVESKRIMC